MSKITLKDLGYNLEGLNNEQRTFVEKNAGMVIAVVEKALEGTMTKKDLEAAVNNAIAENNKKFADYETIKAQNTELLEKVKTLGDTFAKFEQKGISFNSDAFRKKFDEMYDSERFQSYLKGHKDASGAFPGFALKELVAVSMTDNYEGTQLITRADNRPVVEDLTKPLHLRDIIPSIPGESGALAIAWPIIYDLDRNARFLTENGELPESSFKVKEQSTSVTRLGTMLKISNRMLKSRAYVMAFIMQMLPEAIYNAEDWNILFGDGTGNNLPGIVSYQGVKAVEDIIKEAVVSGEAGSIESIEPYNNNKDAVVTFAKAYDHIKDGMTITFEGCTNSSLNASHSVYKMNDRQVLVRNVNITAADTQAAEATFKVNMAGFKNILTPNYLDTIRTAVAVMTLGQYRPRAIVLNPDTINMIESEKDTIGRNLEHVKIVNGVKTICGLPIVEYTGIGTGEYFLGDFQNGCLLVDYSALSLEVADDVKYKSQNMSAILAAEEVILQVRMPFAFSYGKLEAVREAITRA